MSLRYEQYNSLKTTRKFLRDLIMWEGRMNKRDVRERALLCLHHFPFLHDTGEPMFSKDKFTVDHNDALSSGENENGEMV